MQCRRTPLPCGYSPSELLTGRQIRTKIDVLLPSPAHIAQKKQVNQNHRTIKEGSEDSNNPYKEGMLCYALVCGPKNNGKPHWVPATIARVIGARSVTVRVVTGGQIWRRHVDQLRPRHGNTSTKDADITLGNEINLGTPESHLSNRPRRTLKPKVPYDM